MRLRAIVVLSLIGFVLYRISPEERRATWRGRFQEFGRILVITIVVYWIWILAASALGS